MTLEELFAVLGCTAVLGMAMVAALNSRGVIRALLGWMVILGLLALVVFTVFTVVSR